MFQSTLRLQNSQASFVLTKGFAVLPSDSAVGKAVLLWCVIGFNDGVVVMNHNLWFIVPEQIVLVRWFGVRDNCGFDYNWCCSG